MALPPNYLFVNPKDGRLVSRSYLQVPGGTSADPGISFIDSADSGFSCDASGVVSIISDGVQGVTVSSSAVNLLSPVSLTGPLSFPLGTAAAPSLYPGTDTNTGIYSPGADQVAISTNGVSRVFVTGGGNVGIGTTSPAYTLDVNGGIFAESGIRLGNGYSAVDVETGASGLYLSGSQGVTNHVFINSSGRVGIGTVSPGELLSLSGGNPVISLANTTASATNYIATTTAGDFDLNTGNAGDSIVFKIVNTERARIDSSGNVFINTTASTAYFDGRLRVESATTVTSYRTSGASGVILESLWHQATTGDNNFIAFGTETTHALRGSITYNRAGGLVAYNTTSDYRAKTILGDIDNSGEAIDALKVYRGVMNGATVERPMLVAHEAQEVAPYCVTGEKDAVDDDGNPIYQQMDHQALVPLLIAEIQQLRNRVAALEGA
jgi:hypothetical protein